MWQYSVWVGLELYSILSQVADSEMTAEKFAVWCQQWKDPIPFFRLNPSLQCVMSPGEVDDEKLIDMLLDTKLYLAKTVS